ncbi:hypothetical protein [Sphingomonas panaciterrae]|uniref:hypothetical protein n=1 Tax=Sphingomonas panaciterrae TaxID=1462999 RepID=UPI002FF09E31
MTAPLTLERLSEINNALNMFRAARTKAREAAALVPIKEQQTIFVGLKSAGQLQRHSIDVSTTMVNALIRERQASAQLTLMAATRRLHQLNVEVPGDA